MARYGFIELTLQGFARAISRALVSEQLVKENGLLQALDPRVRLLGVLSLVLAVTLSRRLPVVLGLFILSFVISLASRIRLLSASPALLRFRRFSPLREPWPSG